MIWKFALVLFFGKFTNYIYNVFVSHDMSHSYDVNNSFEKRNICKKTARASFYEALTYLLITIICLIFKI